MKTGRKSSSIVNAEEQKKPSWMDRVRGKLAESEQRNPNRITPKPEMRVVRRPVVVDVGQIPVPESTLDVFDSLPTLTLARRATLERMKMNKVLSMEDEYYLNEASQEFDQEVQQDMNDAFGGQEARDRQAEAESLSRQLPDVDSDSMGVHGRVPTRRRSIDDLERNLI